jgi:DNA invertase Pin-like site-specific DNA recombinase
MRAAIYARVSTGRQERDQTIGWDSHPDRRADREAYTGQFSPSSNGRRTL